jgi:predicted DNA-binding transcriptional regulator AlpA
MEKLLTSKDITERCSVCYSTLWRWRKAGLFPESIGIGKLLWTERQITEWMSSRAPPVKDEAFAQRQKNADATLQRHAGTR